MPLSSSFQSVERRLFVKGSDAYRQSKWLSFMKCHLKHARRLLKSTGVLFMATDDNERDCSTIR